MIDTNINTEFIDTVEEKYSVYTKETEREYLVRRMLSLYPPSIDIINDEYKKSIIKGTKYKGDSIEIAVENIVEKLSAIKDSCLAFAMLQMLSINPGITEVLVPEIQLLLN